MNKIEQIIVAREKDVGITVRRILPWVKKRMVGPFIFLDHMGPANLAPPNDHMDVRPHPHIGLATLTYLFDGSILHRDSLGYVQEIVPGEVNWMTAGKGISHSERETDRAREIKRTIHGLQFWVALPVEKEDLDPSFHHHSESEIPVLRNNTHHIKVIAGEYEGLKSPLASHSPMIFMILEAKDKGVFNLNRPKFELAVYLLNGEINIEGTIFSKKEMIVFETGSELNFEHSPDAHFAVIGGEAFQEPRHIWWNLVSSSKEKIEKAKLSWADGSFPKVPGDYERIPLPEN